MASPGIYDNTPTWIPYINNRDCSQRICSLNCPQFCYFALTPPPPVDFNEEGNSSPFNFSPLVIAIIGILASVILVASYYTLISKYCRSSSSTSRARADNDSFTRVSGSLSVRERCFGLNTGLDEVVIQSIAVVKYKKGVGSIEGTCSVCLSEFEEGERVRLLPKCTHPFHVPCIDTWLKSHPSCPLCRSDILFPMLPPTEKEITPPSSSSSSSSPAAVEGAETEDSGERNNDEVIIEVGEECLRPIRRSFSTGHWCPTVADVMKEDEDDGAEDQPWDSKTAKNLSEICKSEHRGIRVSDGGKCTMKRSFSSGRLSISQLARA